MLRRQHLQTFNVNNEHGQVYMDRGMSSSSTEKRESALEHRVVSRASSRRHCQTTLRQCCGAACLLLLGLLAAWNSRYSLELSLQQFMSSKAGVHPSLPLERIPTPLRRIEQCSISTLRRDTGYDFLHGADSIDLSEFVSRRERLAQALHDDGIDAFAVEPGYTFSYYASKV